MRSKLKRADYSGREYIRRETFENAYGKYVFDTVCGEAVARGENGEVLCVEEKIGKGSVIYHASDISDHPIQPAVWPRGEKTPCDRSYIGDMRAYDGALLKLLIGGGFTTCSDENVLVSAFETECGTVLHFVNTKGFIQDHDTFTNSRLPVPPFVKGAEKLGDIAASVSSGVLKLIMITVFFISLLVLVLCLVFGGQYVTIAGDEVMRIRGDERTDIRQHILFSSQRYLVG